MKSLQLLLGEDLQPETKKLLHILYVFIQTQSYQQLRVHQSVLHAWQTFSFCSGSLAVFCNSRVFPMSEYPSFLSRSH